MPDRNRVSFVNILIFCFSEACGVAMIPEGHVARRYHTKSPSNPPDVKGQKKTRPDKLSSLVFDFIDLFTESVLLGLSLGAEGGTRTPTRFPPPPPQDGVSTSSTTSAKIKKLLGGFGRTLRGRSGSIVVLAGDLLLNVCRRSRNLQYIRGNIQDDGLLGGFLSAHDRKA